MIHQPTLCRRFTFVEQASTEPYHQTGRAPLVAATMSSSTQQPLLDGQAERRERPNQVDVDVNRLINGDDARSSAANSVNNDVLPQER